MHTFLPNDAVFWPLPEVDGGWFNESHINEHHLSPGWRPLLDDEMKSHDAGDCCMTFQATFYERSRVDMSRDRSEAIIYITRRALPDPVSVQSPDAVPEDLTDEQKILRFQHIPAHVRKAVIDLPANRGVGGVVMSSLTVNAHLLEIEWPGEMPTTIDGWAGFLSSIKEKPVVRPIARPSPAPVILPQVDDRDEILLSLTCRFVRNETIYYRANRSTTMETVVEVPRRIVERGESAVEEYCNTQMVCDDDADVIDSDEGDVEMYDSDFDSYDDHEVIDCIEDAMNEAGYDYEGEPLETEEETEDEEVAV